MRSKPCLWFLRFSGEWERSLGIVTIALVFGASGAPRLEWGRWDSLNSPVRGNYNRLSRERANVRNYANLPGALLWSWDPLRTDPIQQSPAA